MKTTCMVITNGKVQEFISMEEHNQLMKDQIGQKNNERNENLKSEDKELYSVPDFIKKFQITRPTMYNWIEKGLVEGTKVGGRMYIKGSSVRELLAKSV